MPKSVTTLEDGPIMPSADAPFGFSKNLFDGYLFKKGEEVYISAIISRNQGKGNVRTLFDKIEDAGFKIAVPTPFERMKHILKQRGFAPSIEHDDLMGEVEVWRKSA